MNLLTDATAAIFYHPDGYETNRPHLMGRHAAGESFLKGLSKYGNQSKLTCYAANEKHFQHFAKKVATFKGTARSVEWINWRDWPKLEKSGCLFTPGPVLHELAWQRRHLNNRAFSICGVTHTTATSRVMDAFGEYLISPVQAWDALICTSKCVQRTVITVLNDYTSYLQDRFGQSATQKIPLQLPVIPLGVDLETYDISEDRRSEYRKLWRQKMNIASEEIVVLYFGRLAFHAKAHPVPMYVALEQAAQRSGKKFHLVLAGWFPDNHMRQQFIESARLLCPSIKMTIVDGRHPDVRQQIWYAADIFTSLSDNIQETFGLTPIEAMAAGVPVVVSDWNGYRETVTDGIDGITIKTFMPPAGLGENLALSHAMGYSNYDQYIGMQGQFTSVDVRDCANAYIALAENEGLRSRLAEQSKLKVKNTFDWKVIIPQYLSLWAELAKIRSVRETRLDRSKNGSANPLRSDPNLLFSSYPTKSLSPTTKVYLDEHFSRDRLQLFRAIPMANLASDSLLSTNELFELLNRLSSVKPVSVAELCAQTSSNRGRHLLLSILWLAKVGLVHLDNRREFESDSLALGSELEELSA